MSPPAPTPLARARAAWSSPTGQKLRSIAYWLLLAVMVGFVVRRYLPNRDLLDLGPAPPLTYTSLDGSLVSLSDFEGNVVVVNVWATWCPPCVVETPGFVDLSEEFAGDVQFLGISVDTDLDAVHSFAERYGVTYPLLIGPNQAGPPPTAQVLPTTLVIDKKGRVRLQHEGILLEPILRPLLRTLARESE